MRLAVQFEQAEKDDCHENKSQGQQKQQEQQSFEVMRLLRRGVVCLRNYGQQALSEGGKRTSYLAKKITCRCEQVIHETELPPSPAPSALKC